MWNFIDYKIFTLFLWWIKRKSIDIPKRDMLILNDSYTKYYIHKEDSMTEMVCIDKNTYERLCECKGITFTDKIESLMEEEWRIL